MLNIIKYVLLGLVQGFTEPIPVSSSGHLLIIKKLLENGLNVDFDLLATITNFGSFIAIVIVFWKDIVGLVNDFFKYITTKEKKYKANYRYCWLIVIATIPAGIMGLIIEKLDVFSFLDDNVKFVGVALLVTALFLFLIRNIKGTKNDGKITLKDAIRVGLFQVVALIPGISRSGSTLVGAMFSDIERKSAFKFSFMLYLPITIATMILGVKDIIEIGMSINQLMLYIISAIAAMIMTYFSARWFKGIMEKGKLIYFVWYCLVVGTLVIIFL